MAFSMDLAEMAVPLIRSSKKTMTLTCLGAVIWTLGGMNHEPQPGVDLRQVGLLAAERRPQGKQAKKRRGEGRPRGEVNKDKAPVHLWEDVIQEAAILPQQSWA